MTIKIRLAGTPDYSEILKLNKAAVPNVNSIPEGVLIGRGGCVAATRGVQRLPWDV